MTLKLYNTRTRRKETFRPLDPGEVRMYVCGPTVYDLAHIGNARPVIVFDVLFRLLRHLYGPDRVVYVRNITDVDDKINARAAEEGVSIRELTERTALQFHADVAALGALPPTFEPRATEFIPEMIALIERLIERGHAYAAEGHVLFDVASDPHYGKLARRSTDEMRAGARVEVAPYKRDPMDFVLWKPSEGAEPGWRSPWGYGRPGWHLECSAMASKHLGEVFDIHGGGIDLLFPHHENEVAQSTCAHGTKIMANIWMHNGHLQVEGQKMSKSLGNFVTIRDIASKGRMSAAASRLAMLSTQYRQPMDWTAEKVREAAHALGKFASLVEGWGPRSGLIDKRIAEPLLDDLNTPGAIAGLHEVANEAAAAPDAQRAQCLDSIANALDVLGFGGFRDFTADAWAREQVSVDVAKVEALRDERLAARKARNWAEADRIRDELSAMGISLKDAKNPTSGEIETTWEIAR
ncbi:MAG: cysteine--tRNA ligase [Rhodomicrobium sp.]|jgi:cysteinyl-tRNA synthetase